MIADGDPLVVRQQRIVRAEHRAHVGGVMHRGVEVGVVITIAGIGEPQAVGRKQHSPPQHIVVAQDRAVRAKEARQRLTQMSGLVLLGIDVVPLGVSEVDNSLKQSSIAKCVEIE